MAPCTGIRLSSGSRWVSPPQISIGSMGMVLRPFRDLSAAACQSSSSASSLRTSVTRVSIPHKMPKSRAISASQIATNLLAIDGGFLMASLEIDAGQERLSCRGGALCVPLAPGVFLTRPQIESPRIRIGTGIVVDEEPAAEGPHVDRLGTCPHNLGPFQERARSSVG